MTDDTHEKPAAPPADGTARRLFTEMALLGPAEILKPLWSPAEAVARFKEFGSENARDFLLYQVLLDVQRAGLAMWRFCEFAEKQDGRGDRGNIDDLEIEGRLAEQSLWQRRLVEKLILLVGFAQTNQVDYYYHYLLVADLARCLFENGEQREFFGAQSSWLEEQVKVRRRSLAELRTSDRVERERCWYLRPGIDETTTERPHLLLESARTLFIHALEHGTPTERRSLGYCYGNGFSAPSNSVHFDPVPLERTGHPVAKQLEFAFLQSGFLCAAILTRVQELLGIQRETPGCIFARQASQSSAVGGITCEVPVGDFVVVILGQAQPFLGEVVERIRSRHGNECYRVRFVGEEPVPGLGTDVVTADRIQPYVDRASVEADARQLVTESLRDGHTIDEIPQEEFAEFIRDAAVHTWRAAFRDIYVRHLNDAKKRA